MLAALAAAFFLCGHIDAHGNHIGEPCRVHPARHEFGLCWKHDPVVRRCALNSPERIVCHHARHGRTVCEDDARSQYPGPLQGTPGDVATDETGHALW